MRILLLGSIGSGKSTQAQIIAQHLNYSFIRSGDLVREKSQEDTQEGKLCKEALEAGELAPDEIVAKLVQDKLATLGSVKGIIFDGYIRRISQLQYFDPQYDKVIYLKVPEDIVRERLSRRERVDDSPEIIEHRLEVYHQQTEPLIKYYTQKGILSEIDASGTVDQVTENIEQYFEEYFNG